MSDIRRAIAAYVPRCEQEEKDRAFILAFLERNPDAFFRSNPVAHMTASAWVVNPARDRVLMVYHKIYDSWSWTGGHADGDEDLPAVALREVREETGVRSARLVSDEILSLEGPGSSNASTKSSTRGYRKREKAAAFSLFSYFYAVYLWRLRPQKVLKRSGSQPGLTSLTASAAVMTASSLSRSTSV